MSDELIGGRYRLGVRVGSGAMGIVWRAQDERLGRTVALKEVTPSPGAHEGNLTSSRRVMREARLSARLHHPNAISVFDVVEHDGEPWLVMEYLPSRDLADVLAEGTMAPTEVARIGSEVAAALTAAHDAGIVHRDVKPGNILLAEDGRVKVTDFGISRAIDEATLTSTGMVAGTPAYLAPEVARGNRADFRSDVWSLGATLYAAMEGQPPFGRNENALAQLHRVASGEIIPPQHSGALTPVLQRVLQADADRRPPVGEVRHELARVLASEGGTEAVPDPLTPALPRPAPVSSDPRATGSGPPRVSGAALAAAPSRTAPPGRTSAPALSSAPSSSAPSSSARSPGGAAAGPAPAGPTVPGPTAPAPDRPRATPSGRPQRRRRLAVLLAAVVLVGVALGAVLLSTAGTDGGTASPSAVPATPSAGATDAAGSGEDTPPTASAAADPPASAAVPVTDAAAQQQAITAYYGLLPNRLEEGWEQLTPSYRSGTAGGFGGYTTFWRPMAQVTVRGVSAQPPDSVDATVTYSYRDGRVVDERTLFRMVLQDGRWKIDDSRVLSSRGR